MTIKYVINANNMYLVFYVQWCIGLMNYYLLVVVVILVTS